MRPEIIRVGSNRYSDTNAACEALIERHRRKTDRLPHREDVALDIARLRKQGFRITLPTMRVRRDIHDLSPTEVLAIIRACSGKVQLYAAADEHNLDGQQLERFAYGPSRARLETRVALGLGWRSKLPKGWQEGGAK